MVSVAMRDYDIRQVINRIASVMESLDEFEAAARVDQDGATILGIDQDPEPGAVMSQRPSSAQQRHPHVTSPLEQLSSALPSCGPSAACAAAFHTSSTIRT